MTIDLPRHLSLNGNYEATADAINRLRRYVLTEKIHVHLNFRLVEDAELAATLVLTAEIDRCRKFGGTRAVHGNYPSSPRVYRQLHTMGFFKLLGIRSMSGEAPADYIDPGVRVLPFVAGDSVDGTIIDRFLEDLLHSVSGVQDQSRRDLYGCLIEAIKNATEHANKEKTPQKAIPKRWWMAGSSKATEGECAIVVFDQGAGIPRTLPPNVLERLKALLVRISSPSSDSISIRAATKIGRTSTAHQGRGKGFTTMKKFVARSSRGELVVYSLRGKYRYVSNESGARVDRLDQASSLGGTLVQWRMQHSSVTQEGSS